MAISTNYDTVKKEYNPEKWKSIDEFEAFYLREIQETTSDWNYYTNKCGEEITIEPIKHHPELKEYEVWMEGYAATGESGGAQLIGKTKAQNFAQACHIVMCEQKLNEIKEENNPSNTEYCDPCRWDYSPHQLSYWACKLFWSKELASKSFG